MAFRRAATGAAANNGAAVQRDIDEAKIDLVTLSADSYKLLNASVALAVVLVPATIWDDIIPALSILEDVRLWNQTALVDGTL